MDTILNSPNSNIYLKFILF